MVCSGMVWALIGGWLLYKGIYLIAEGTFGSEAHNSWIRKIFGKKEGSVQLAVGFALLVGFLKGRFVLSKTVRRVCCRIASLPLPISPKDVYSFSYVALILGMMVLGMSLRFFPLAMDLKGLVDVAIGSALFSGSFLYFRAARAFEWSLEQNP